MKLLFVAPDLPNPALKGYQLVLARHIEFLAKRHFIDLIAFRDCEQRAIDLGDLPMWCNNLETIKLPIWRSFWNLFVGAFTDRPWQVSYYRSREMARVIENRLRRSTYDVVIFHLTRMAQYRPDWYEGVTVLNMVDPLVLSYQRSLAWRPWYTRTAVLSEIARLSRYEAQEARYFRRVLLLTNKDAQDYQVLLNGARVDTTSHGVDVDFYSPFKSVPRQDGRIIITGNMGYAPNIDAVQYFCRHIFPRVLKEEPNAQLWIVGARPSRVVQKLANDKTVMVTGFVPDIRPYLAEAMVSVCPVRLSVGTLTKVLEALAMGTPVVTTTAGNNGINAVSGEHLYVADSPEDFANKVVALLRGECWQELFENGRRFVVEHFSWDKSATKLERVLEELVGRTTQDRT